MRAGARAGLAASPWSLSYRRESSTCSFWRLAFCFLPEPHRSQDEIRWAPIGCAFLDSRDPDERQQRQSDGKTDPVGDGGKNQGHGALHQRSALFERHISTPLLLPS